MEKYTVKLKRLEESKWLPSEFKKIDPDSYRRAMQMSLKLSRDFTPNEIYVLCIELLATLNIDKETRIVNDILYREFQKWL